MKYYKMLEVAQMFNVSKQAVYKWVTEGKIKHIRLADTTIRIPAEEVLKMQEIKRG
jgi:excisionase family DNA binding protein